MRPDIQSKELDGLTMWSLGTTALVMIPRLAEWSPELLAAYDRRVEAGLTGVCACGGVIDNVQGLSPGQGRGSVVHEDDCPATDTNFVELMKRG